MSDRQHCPSRSIYKKAALRLLRLGDDTSAELACRLAHTSVGSRCLFNDCPAQCGATVAREVGEKE